jgi:hypothetical protein
MAHSELVFEAYQNVAGGIVTGRMTVPIELQTFTSDLGDVAAAVVALFGGNGPGFLATAGVLPTSYLKIPLGVSTTPVAGEIRDNWQMSVGATDPFRFQIPGRNPNTALEAAGSHGSLGDLSATAFAALITALTATAGARIVNPESEAVMASSDFIKARSQVSTRVRPRV